MAKYQDLADRLKKQIQSGIFQDGAKLETETELMRKYQLSRQTVRQAVGVLENEGYVTRRQGSGTFVSLRAPQPAAKDQTVGVVCTYLSEYIFPHIISGIESVLTDSGYTLFLAATQNQADVERTILQSYLEKSVSGLIVEGSKTALPNPNIHLYQKMEEMGIPTLFIHAKYREMPHAVHVAMDDRTGGHDAVRHLFQKGHHKIAGIFKSTDWQGHMRYAGYLDGIQEYGLPFSDERVLWFQDNKQLDFLLQSGALLSYFKDATAVVCYNDQVASLVVKELKSKGVGVPSDLSVVSFDNSFYADLTEPPLTSFAHPKEALGRAAAEKIINLIRGETESSLIIDWQLVERNSVKTVL